MSVASKNLFEILGNDPDSDGEVKAPTREVVKQKVVSKKKDVVVEAPTQAPPKANRGGRRYGGNEGAFRDRETGSERNRQRNTDNTGEHVHDGPRRGGRGGARGGQRGRGREFDRHSQTGRADTAKQTGQGWGANTGNAEWTDEKVGQSIAEGQAAGSGWDAADPATAEVDEFAQGNVEAPKEEQAEPEPEEKLKTLEDYKAELAARQANLGPPPSVRRPNEGSRENKKWANAVPLAKDDDEDAFIAPKEGKQKPPKERKTKQLLEIDATAETGNRRGGSGRGGRGDRGDRGRGGRGGRGEFRGERRGGAPSYGQAPGKSSVVKIDDTKAFPALGA